MQFSEWLVLEPSLIVADTFKGGVTHSEKEKRVAYIVFNIAGEEPWRRRKGRSQEDPYQETGRLRGRVESEASWFQNHSC